MPLSIFRVRTIRAANVAMFLLAAGIFAMFYFNSLYMQRVLGYSPLEAGLGSLPFTLGIMVGAGAAQQLVARVGAREAGLMGVVLAVVGLLLFLRLEPDSTYLSGLLWPIVIVSVGMGLAFVPVTLIATAGVGEQTAGLASGLFNTSQQIGGALGLAVLATLAASETSVRSPISGVRRGLRTRRRRSSTASTSPSSAARSSSPAPGWRCSCSFAARTSRRSARARPHWSSRRAGAQRLLEHAADAAHGLADPLLVLDEREADVALAAGAEALAGADRHLRLPGEHGRERERAALATPRGSAPRRTSSRAAARRPSRSARARRRARRAPR